MSDEAVENKENSKLKPKLTPEEKDKIREMRDAWKERKHLTTLPAWKDDQTKAIDQAKDSLKDIDDETKEWVMRELLITLRCHFCERRRSNSCNFPICVRGLLSGIDSESNNKSDK
ncbi:MAG: hypothetical protein KAJ51_10835 [Thermoplasmata archaeon]|nr:hypothetical protein [Thermoplasmata archaeon]